MPRPSAPILHHPFAQTVLCALITLAVALPWLNPFTWGPVPEMVQRLLSAGCAVLVVIGWIAWRQHSPQDLGRAIAMGWLLAALLSAAIGLLQYFGANIQTLAPWINGAETGQAYGNLRQRNQYASLITLGLIAWLYLNTMNNRSRLWQTLGVLAVGMLALGNAVSGSRTGALQWVAVGLLAATWARNGTSNRTLRWSLIALALYLILTLSLPTLLQTLTGVNTVNALERFQEQVGCASRSVLWSNVLELIAHRPWLGWGWGELKFAHFIFPYEGERFCELLDNAHNLPLHMAVTLGLPIALFLGGALLLLIRRARPWRETSPLRQLAWAALGLVGIHSLLEYPLWYGPFQIAVALCLHLLCRTSNPSTQNAPHAGKAPWIAALAGLSMAMIAFVSWDYWRVGQLYLPPEARASNYQENTMGKVQNSWLFRAEVQFAYVSTAVPNAGTAESLYAASLQTLHFSPEPRVISTLLASAALLGDQSSTVQHIRARERAIYGPKD